MQLLLLSNSRNPNEQPFAWAISSITSFFGEAPKTLALVPFAGVTISYDEYAAFVRNAFTPLGYTIRSVHESEDAHEVVRSADGILVGGGNSFRLIDKLHRTDLLHTIREQVHQGKPYLGWSAGANVACPTMRTTNDMPIVQPPSFEALNFVPFQINPHYTNETLPHHGGETRDDRLNEFVAVNADVHVVGLPEGCLLHVENGSIRLVGNKPIRVFRQGASTTDYTHTDSVQFLMS